MNNHTSQSLGKYYGKYVFIENIKKPKYRQTEEVCWELLKNIRNGYSDFNIYPILKTAEDLTYEEKKEIYSRMVCFSFLDDDFIDKTQRFPQLSIKNGTFNWTASFKIGKDLLNISAGAIPDKSSPTGYISIHDNLPCKAWSEVFK